jgi:hypothetical protein
MIETLPADRNHPFDRFLSFLFLRFGGPLPSRLAPPPLDLGYDDNLTLPILTGAIVWVWLTVVSWLTTATTSTTSTTF